jgi:protein CWC15
MERDFRAELEEKEAKHFKTKKTGDDLMLGDGSGTGAEGGPGFVPKALDADDSDNDSDDDDNDSDDDEVGGCTS